MKHYKLNFLSGVELYRVLIYRRCDDEACRVNLLYYYNLNAKTKQQYICSVENSSFGNSLHAMKSHDGYFEKPSNFNEF